jgi:hypothetical protein
MNLGPRQLWTTDADAGRPLDVVPIPHGPSSELLAKLKAAPGTGMPAELAPQSCDGPVAIPGTFELGDERDKRYRDQGISFPVVER